MTGLVVALWIMAALAGSVVVMAFLGSILIGKDQVDATRYVANKLEKEHHHDY